MAQTQENKKTFYIVLIAILLLLNGFFIYKHITVRKELAVVTERKNELDSLLTVASGELKMQQTKNEELLGHNAELDSMLKAREAELQDAVNQLNKLKKEGFSRKELDQARERVKRLQAENEQFQARIDSLNTQLKYVTMERDSINTGLQQQKKQNELLQGEKQMLAQKVAIGSLLKPENIVATGMFTKSNGRDVPILKAKKVQKLSICFDVPENKVADPGTKTIMLRILNPQGATIWVTSSGSGSFTTDTGEEKQYTTAAQFEYNNQKQTVCVPWTQTQAFGSGDYNVFFYQDGHELGSTKFTLK